MGASGIKATHWSRRVDEATMREGASDNSDCIINGGSVWPITQRFAEGTEMQ
jgi:hypothetical protein